MYVGHVCPVCHGSAIYHSATIKLIAGAQGHKSQGHKSQNHFSKKIINHNNCYLL